MLFDLGYTKQVTDELDRYGIQYTMFTDVHPDPLLSDAKKGAEAMANFQPMLLLH